MSEIFRGAPHEINALPGQDIRDFALQLIEYSEANGVDAFGMFNGVIMRVQAGVPVTVAEVIALHNVNSERFRDRSYEESRLFNKLFRSYSEGRKAVEERNKLEKKRSEKLLQLMEDLKKLDFEDYESLLDWIDTFKTVSEYPDLDAKRTIDVFGYNGFGVIVGKSFNEEHAGDFARYIVGQFLWCLAFDKCYIFAEDGLLDVLISRWKEKFGKRNRVDRNLIESIKENEKLLDRIQTKVVERIRRNLESSL